MTLAPSAHLCPRSLCPQALTPPTSQHAPAGPAATPSGPIPHRLALPRPSCPLSPLPCPGPPRFLQEGLACCRAVPSGTPLPALVTVTGHCPTRYGVSSPLVTAGPATTPPDDVFTQVDGSRSCSLIYPQGVCSHNRRSQGEFAGKSFPTNDLLWVCEIYPSFSPKAFGKFRALVVLGSWRIFSKLTGLAVDQQHPRAPGFQGLQ